MEKVKKHLRENRKVYIGTASGIAVGAIGMFVYLVKHGYAVSDEENRKIQIRYFEGFLNQVSGKKNRIFQRISIYGTPLGRPGNRVIDLDTMKEYASQTLAAHDVGVSDTRMWRHLRGDYPHVHGRRFARIIEEV